MKSVEQYPSFYWGGNLKVRRFEDSLLITAVSSFWVDEVCPEHNRWDLLAEYRKAPKTGWSKGRTGKNSPHIQFANADTDEKLIAFVEKFGPIVASHIREVLPDTKGNPYPPKLIAVQKMNELRSERTIYQAALTLLSELTYSHKADIKRIQNCTSQISKEISAWRGQWRRERSLRKTNSDAPPSWRFDEEAMHAINRADVLMHLAGNSIRGRLRAGHYLLCELVNAYPTFAYVCENLPTEAPNMDLCYGIKPLLYHILRREYLQRGRIAICENSACRELFEVERTGARFCTAECSRQQRQRDYWDHRGKKLRNERREVQRTAAEKENGKGR